MSFTYNKLKTKVLNADVDFVTDDIRVLLVGASTTADTEDDTDFVGDFTTLDEIVATNYARQALASEAVNEDLPNNRAEFDATDPVFTSLGGAANDTIQAAIIYKHVTNDTDSPVICYLDQGSSFNLTTNGGNVTLQFDAEGILQAT